MSSLIEINHISLSSLETFLDTTDYNLDKLLTCVLDTFNTKTMRIICQYFK